MQIRENWSDVRGTVTAVSESGVPGFVNVRVAIDTSDSVDGFPNLIARHAGSELTIEVPQKGVPDMNVMQDTPLRFHGRVRIAGPASYFADPDRFSIESAPERTR